MVSGRAWAHARFLFIDRRVRLAKGGACEEESEMLKWALIFLVISVVAGVLGFTGIAAGSAAIAKVLFTIFLVLFLVFLVAGLLIAKKIT